MTKTLPLALAIVVAAMPPVAPAAAQDADTRALAFYEANCAQLDLEFLQGHTFGRRAGLEPYILANEECVQTAFYLGLIEYTYDADCRHLLLFFCW